MPEANVIHEHMEVIDVDGHHVGTVESVEDHMIKLTRSKDDGEHHYVAKVLVQNIRGNAVTLTKPAAEALRSSNEV